MLQKFLIFIFFYLGIQPLIADGIYTVSSPNNRIEVNIMLSELGEPMYSVTLDNQPIVAKSKLGIALIQENMYSGFDIIKNEKSSFDERWIPVWGEVSKIRNNYNQIILTLKNKKGITFFLNFRVFDDGVGFRYEFEPQNKVKTLVVSEEMTEFNLTGDHKSFWIPGDYDSNEHIYSSSKISAIDGAIYQKDEHSIFTRHIEDNASVATPITFKTDAGKYICIHEAALVNYSAMQLHITPATFQFKAALVPSDARNIKAICVTPFHTPWRTINIADNAAGLLESKMILNLNEPSKIQNTDWIKPIKFVGIWWEMHLGKSSWSYSNQQNITEDTKLVPNGKHGANTKNTMDYIDFAAKNGIGGVLVEGWNVGWEDWFGKWKENVFDFTTPYPDYDLKKLAAYGLSKNVQIIVHHETSAAATSYEKRLEPAFDLMNSLGLNSIKSGYVGKIIPKGEWHDGQKMVNHYNKVLAKAANHKIMVDAHEPVRPTGLHRTYPNFLACEAARGNEFNAWSRGNPPDHETILPFTRIMGGPMDYTPGIFDINFRKYKNTKEQVHTTVAKQLALYVTLYSPIQMAADLIENYENNPAFQFIKAVAVDWDETKVLEAEVGDYITTARKAKGTNNWFVGSITDENKRESSITLNFLDSDKKYIATIYSDGKDADFESNPFPVEINKMNVDSKSKINLKLARSGGCAISIMEAK
jgi:glucan 1,4-alpha-glucosidase